jgi:hypothetical protein
MKFAIKVPIGPGFSAKMTIIQKFAEAKEIHMGHFKRTCPNPHSGEAEFGYPPEAAIIDMINKAGLWMTKYEFDFMTSQRYISSDTVIIEIEEENGKETLESYVYKYRGILETARFNI